jgi:Tfp pilus assembly protein FimV
MCGGRPSAPQVVYQGPSQADIEANQRALDQYKTQMADQQAAFQKQLQDQIDAANAESAKLQKQQEESTAAAAAAAAAQQNGSYAVTASQSTPNNAQTTTAAAPKAKPKSSLKITSGAVASTAGSGLNIGV